jgi:hypothetical protein
MPSSLLSLAFHWYDWGEDCEFLQTRRGHLCSNASAAFKDLQHCKYPDGSGSHAIVEESRFMDCAWLSCAKRVCSLKWT